MLKSRAPWKCGCSSCIMLKIELLGKIQVPINPFFSLIVDVVSFHTFKEVEPTWSPVVNDGGMEKRNPALNPRRASSTLPLKACSTTRSALFSTRKSTVSPVAARECTVLKLARYLKSWKGSGVICHVYECNMRCSKQDFSHIGKLNCLAQIMCLPRTSFWITISSEVIL